MTNMIEQHRQKLIRELTKELRGAGLTSPQIAYVLATVKHETANTFLPIKEYGQGKGRPYGLPDPHTKLVYYGRGYVQLTWKYNYYKMGQLLKQPLVSNPDLALRPDIALDILIEGMKRGMFTGKKLSDYINDEKVDYVGARRIINGTDKAELIASYAKQFEEDLRK